MPALAQSISIPKETAKTLALAVGIREASRQLGINENTMLAWSSRDPAGPWTVQQPERNQNAIITPSEALKASLQDDSEQTRISLSKSVRRGAQALEKASENDPERVFNKAKNVKELVGAASQLHGWEQKQEASNVMVNIGILGVQPDSIQIDGHSPQH